MKKDCNFEVFRRVLISCFIFDPFLGFGFFFFFNVDSVYVFSLLCLINIQLGSHWL